VKSHILTVIVATVSLAGCEHLTGDGIKPLGQLETSYVEMHTRIAKARTDKGGDKPNPTPPVPVKKTCADMGVDCKGTGWITSGDGLMREKCPCGDNCQCPKRAGADGKCTCGEGGKCTCGTNCQCKASVAVGANGCNPGCVPETELQKAELAKLKLEIENAKLQKDFNDIDVELTLLKTEQQRIDLQNDVKALKEERDKLDIEVRNAKGAAKAMKGAAQEAQEKAQEAPVEAPKVLDQGPPPEPAPEPKKAAEKPAEVKPVEEKVEPSKPAEPAPIAEPTPSKAAPVKQGAEPAAPKDDLSKIPGVVNPNAKKDMPVAVLELPSTAIGDEGLILQHTQKQVLCLVENAQFPNKTLSGLHNKKWLVSQQRWVLEDGKRKLSHVYVVDVSEKPEFKEKFAPSRFPCYILMINDHEATRRYGDIGTDDVSFLYKGYRD